MEEYKALFPSLVSDEFEITSPLDPHYNCIAWAASENDVWWWPTVDAYWPDGLPLDDSVETFVSAFGVLGYTPCDSDEVEDGFDKVVIYAEAGRAKHMARQLPSGKWTSKLGRSHDVSHGRDWHLSGNTYGQCVQYLRRPSRAADVE